MLHATVELYCGMLRGVSNIYFTLTDINCLDIVLETPPFRMQHNSTVSNTLTFMRGFFQTVVLHCISFSLAYLIKLVTQTCPQWQCINTQCRLSRIPHISTTKVVSVFKLLTVLHNFCLRCVSFCTAVCTMGLLSFCLYGVQVEFVYCSIVDTL